MAIQLLDQVWPAEDRARLRVVKQQVGSWVGSWASGAWGAGEGMASRPRAFCCRVLGSKPPRLGAVPQPGGGLGDSSAAPQRRTPPAPSRRAGSVDAGPAGAGAAGAGGRWGKSGRSPAESMSGESSCQLQAGGQSSRRVHPGRERPHRVHAGRESVPTESMPGESPRCVCAGRESVHAESTGTERVPAASVPGERALTPSPPGQRESPLRLCQESMLPSSSMWRPSRHTPHTLDRWEGARSQGQACPEQMDGQVSC